MPAVIPELKVLVNKVTVNGELLYTVTAYLNYKQVGDLHVIKSCTLQVQNERAKVMGTYNVPIGDVPAKLFCRTASTGGAVVQVPTTIKIRRAGEKNITANYNAALQLFTFQVDGLLFTAPEHPLGGRTYGNYLVRNVNY